MLAEKAIAHVTVQVDLRAGEQLGPAYRAINPRCTVPALVLPCGTLLPDNASIAAWAEAAHPEPPLAGRTPVEKAMVAHWSARAEWDGLFAIAEAMRNTSPAFANRALSGPVDYAQVPALAERGLDRLRRFLDDLDARLAASAFVAGDALSLADITACVSLDFARVVKVRLGPDHPNLSRWRAALATRPSFSL